MGDLNKPPVNQPWRADQLAQSLADGLVERWAAGNPAVALVYGKYRPLVHHQLGRLFAPLPVKRGRR